MKKVILAVYNNSDLSAIKSAVKALANFGTTHLWVLHSPSLGLPYPDAAKEIDKEIQALVTAKESAVKREDYTSAANYRNDENAAKVRRDIALTNAYKPLSPEELKKAYDQAFSSVTKEEIPSLEVCVIEPLSEPGVASDIFIHLQKMTAGNWIKEFSLPECVIAFPRALVSEIRSSPNSSGAEVINVPTMAIPVLSDGGDAGYKSQFPPNRSLSELHWNDIRKLATSLEVKFHGLSREELEKQIQEKQASLNA